MRYEIHSLHTSPSTELCVSQQVCQYLQINQTTLFDLYIDIDTHASAASKQIFRTPPSDSFSWTWTIFAPGPRESFTGLKAPINIADGASVDRIDMLVIPLYVDQEE